jgi:hypothetical protein
MKRVAVLLLFLPITASAWTHASDERIAKKSASLAPADLRLVLERFEPEYLAGVALAESDEGSESHHFFVLSRSGKLRERIQRETFTAIAMIRKGEPMSSVAERLGILAHLLTDANNPFHTANTDERMALVHDDFEQYFERRMARFPTFFYGLDPTFTLDNFLDQTFSRSSRLYPLMTEEYFGRGEQQSSAMFDDRSTAFGVASVCYSHAVTDIVNLYFYIWREAGGDVRGAPSLRKRNVFSSQ